MKKIYQGFFITIFYALSLISLAGEVNTLTPPLSDRPEVKAFIQGMVQKHQFNQNDLTKTINKITLQPKIVALMDKPSEGKAWKEYRPIFITPQRIQEGVAFWQKHAATLKAVEQHYQVPASVIVAIIGVETFYGKNTGSFLVIDALATLGFDYPRRATFFQDQLKEFLLLTREEKMDPFSIKGSYAGAMGPGQFMPSSYRQYAVDFDKGGQRDLLNNRDDAIASVANYLKAHGWQYGRPVAVLAHTQGTQYEKLLDKGSQPFTTIKEVNKLGVKTKTKVDPNTSVSVLALEGAHGREVWLTMQNFYVITKYNKSPMYALAVFQLSEAIAQAKKSS